MKLKPPESDPATTAVQGERTREVHALLSHLLERGELGHPLPPERYLAVMFSCSRVTIRRVLAAHNGVSRERGRGTFAFQGPPILGLDDLRKTAAKQDVIAMLTDDVGDYVNTALAPFFYSLYLALRQAQPEAQFVIARTGEVLAGAKGLKEIPGFRGMVAPGYQWSPEQFETAYQSGIPFVAIGRCSLDLYWNIVDLSWDAVVAQAIDDLAVTPADRVLILGQKYNQMLDFQQLHGLFLQHLDARGVPAEQIEFGESGVFESDGYFATRRYLARHGLPNVIIADGDLAAAGAYRALHDRLSGRDKIRIGKDVRILGAGNFLITEYLSPQLSTFEFNRAALAKAILDLLEELRQGKRQIGLRHVPVSYVARQSTSVNSLNSK